MKTNLVLKNIEIAGVKIGEVAVEQEYSVSEILKLANGSKNFVKELLKDLPEMLADLKKTEVTLFDKCISAINNSILISEIDEIIYETDMSEMSFDEIFTICKTASKRKRQLLK